jgi:hypothetical protein
MTIEARHFEQARALVAEHTATRSPEYRAGYTYMLAWHLAGRPAPTEDRCREHDCPHDHGTAQRDAWASGWFDAFHALSAPTALPLDAWEESEGPVLWWVFPIEEPPYCGTPLDTDWPGYHTHWTSIRVPGKGAQWR